MPIIKILPHAEYCPAEELAVEAAGLLSEEEEDDLLDRAWGLQPNSRLSCQAILAQKDLVIEIPKYSVNHAKENH